MNRLVAGLIGGVLAGLALGWQIWGGDAPIVETPLPEVRQRDSSLMLERKPDAAAKPKHLVPKGATVERVATVTVQPTPQNARSGRPPVEGSARLAPQSPVAGTGEQEATSDPSSAQDCSCAPVHVDLSLVRLEDGTRRVIASARGGTVLGGVDVPVESARQVRVLRWAVGPSYDLHAQRWGVAVDRDVDRVLFLRIPARAGVTLGPGTEGGLTGSVRVQIRF